MAKSQIDSFHELLKTCVQENASDLHLKEGANAILRITGTLTPLDFFVTHDFMDEIINAIVQPRQRDEYDETGDLDLSYAKEGIGRFRVNIHRQRASHAMTLRYVKNKIRSSKELGLPPVVEKIARMSRGIILVCGTTGSGKSTTLAAMLDFINRKRSAHIITIEDPIEYEFEDRLALFEQREVGLDVISFSSALTHALRQDPDIIMVGEMRDRESFTTALHAADTGHLVISTIHATNASQTINRLLDMFPKSEQAPILEALSINLCATIAQRLLPKAFGGGVVPAVEVMINTPIVKKLLHENKLGKLANAIASGAEDDMITFNASLLEHVNSGNITEETALNASDEPDALKMNLKGIFLSTEKIL